MREPARQTPAPPQSLVEALESARFEHALSIAQVLFYGLERQIGHALFRRPPPNLPAPVLLNLGCGPHHFEGWINADDYAFKRALRENQFRPNWRLDITRPWRCPSDLFDGIFTEHVLELITYSAVVNTLKEAKRTMQPGAWLRISLPDLAKFARHYNGDMAEARLGDFPHPAMAVSYLTQMHHHRSTWDADLMAKVLTGLGFESVREAAFRQSADPRLARDDPSKQRESFYVEARKPTA